jgi:hypothetical protein
MAVNKIPPADVATVHQAPKIREMAPRTSQKTMKRPQNRFDGSPLLSRTPFPVIPSHLNQIAFRSTHSDPTLVHGEVPARARISHTCFTPDALFCRESRVRCRADEGASHDCLELRAFEWPTGLASISDLVDVPGCTRGSRERDPHRTDSKGPDPCGCSMRFSNRHSQQCVSGVQLGAFDSSGHRNGTRSRQSRGATGVTRVPCVRSIASRSRAGRSVFGVE